MIALTSALLACGSGETGDSGDEARPASTTSTTSTTSKPPGCSAVGLPAAPERQGGLPSGVEEMRDAIAGAAVACDYDELVRLGDLHGPGLRVGFGEPPADPADEWRQAEEGGHGLPPMFYLRRLLDLPFTRIVVAEGDAAPLLYGWPSAFDPEGASPSDLAAVVDAGLYSQAQLDQMLDDFGGYAGYRVLISANGDWQAFVTGD